MAWNEPGDNNKNEDKDANRDPWSGRKNAGKPKDLDDALNQLQKKFSKFVGKKSSGGDGSSSGVGISLGIGIIFFALIVIWVLTGFFVVQAPEKAVVLRFGKYYETLEPGLHWIPRFIDSETALNVRKVFSYTYPSNEDALMLTKDQNIVAVAITVQFKIDNPQNFLFNVVNPIDSLHQATASALRQVVGQMDLDSILTTGREKLRQDVKVQLEEILQRYKSGLEITNVLLKSAQAPDAVKAAFDDAVKAQEDEKRFVNQAQAYAMKVEPIAQGQAKRIISAAKAYQQKVVLNAQANVKPFLALLPEYKQAPEVTRERMYLDALEQVFHNSSKVLVDSGKNTNNLLYLPIEKLLSQSNADTKKVASTKAATETSVVPSVPKTTSNNSTVLNRPSRDLSSFGYGQVGGTQ